MRNVHGGGGLRGPRLPIPSLSPPFLRPCFLLPAPRPQRGGGPGLLSPAGRREGSDGASPPGTPLPSVHRPPRRSRDHPVESNGRGILGPYRIFHMGGKNRKVSVAPSVFLRISDRDYPRVADHEDPPGTRDDGAGLSLARPPSSPPASSCFGYRSSGNPLVDSWGGHGLGAGRRGPGDGGTRRLASIVR